MLWKEVVVAALLGSDEQPLSPPPPDTPLGSLLAGLDWSDREGSLLRAAAVMALYQRAGSVPAPLDTAAQEPLLCEPDELPRCTPRAAHHLAMMLQGHYTQVLSEWLSALRLAEQRLPEEYLPDLLDMGVTRRDLRGAIVPVLGKRGHWLAAQNSVWDYAALDTTHSQSSLHDDTTVADIWQTGSREARKALLGHIAATDPARARELLASTWSQEPADDRALFISMFAAKLSMEDEPFLEAALDDRSKNVRRAVMDLLASLPDSRLSQRMRERVSPLLTLKRGILTGKGKLLVTLPEACDKAMIRDGIEPKPPDKKIGEKAWWLRQMLAVIPPSFWCQQWQVTPSNLLHAIHKHEWEQMLLDGWTEAARRHHDVEWAEALLTEWPKRIGEGILSSLLELLPTERREAFLQQQLQADQSAHTGLNSVIAILSYSSHPWSDNLSRIFVEYLRSFIIHDDAKRNYWQWQSSIKEFATNQISPAIANEITSGWPTDAAAWNRWETTINDLITILLFRHEMLNEIGAPARRHPFTPPASNL